MYADTITDSMRKAIDETDRRRRIQMHNEKHGITPQTIQKSDPGVIEATKVARRRRNVSEKHRNVRQMAKKEREN